MQNAARNGMKNMSIRTNQHRVRHRPARLKVVIVLLMIAGLTRTNVAGSTGELPCFAEIMIIVESARPCASSADTMAPID